jgi:hypothetical protein
MKERFIGKPQEIGTASLLAFKKQGSLLLIIPKDKRMSLSSLPLLDLALTSSSGDGPASGVNVLCYQFQDIN